MDEVIAVCQVVFGLSLQATAVAEIQVDAHVRVLPAEVNPGNVEVHIFHVPDGLAYFVLVVYATLPEIDVAYGYCHGGGVCCILGGCRFRGVG